MDGSNYKSGSLTFEEEGREPVLIWGFLVRLSSQLSITKSNTVQARCLRSNSFMYLFISSLSVSGEPRTEVMLPVLCRFEYRKAKTEKIFTTRKMVEFF